MAWAFADNARSIIRWHEDMLSRLEAASERSPSSNAAAAREALCDLEGRGFLEGAFRRESSGQPPADDRDGAFVALLQNLYSCAETEALAKRAEGILEASGPIIRELVEIASAAATTRVRWLLLPRNTREDAAGAVNRLEEMRTGDYGAEAGKLADRLEPPLAVSAEEALALYGESPSRPRELLGKYCDVELGEGDPPAEVASVLFAVSEVRKADKAIRETKGKLTEKARKAADDMASANAREGPAGAPNKALGERNETSAHLVTTLRALFLLREIKDGLSPLSAVERGSSLLERMPAANLWLFSEQSYRTNALKAYHRIRGRLGNGAAQKAEESGRRAQELPHSLSSPKFEAESWHDLSERPAEYAALLESVSPGASGKIGAGGTLPASPSDGAASSERNAAIPGSGISSAEKSAAVCGDLRRVSADFYDEEYEFTRTILNTSADWVIAPLRHVPVSSIRVKPHAGEGRRGSLDVTVPNPGEQQVFSVIDHDNVIADLADVGYLIEFASFEITNEPTRESRRFDKEWGIACEEYKDHYSAVLQIRLTRPMKLLGEEIAPVTRPRPARRSAPLDAYHRAICSIGSKKGLTPNEKGVAEFLACGFSKNAIADEMLWKPSEVARLAKRTYERIGVRSRAALLKLLDSMTGNGPEELHFDFEIAGTSHYRAANNLWKSKPGQLSAAREPENEYDANAIAIKLRGKKVGYVPRALAAEIANYADSGYSMEVTSYSAGDVRLVCTAPARKRERPAPAETGTKAKRAQRPGPELSEQKARAALRSIATAKRLSDDEVEVLGRIAAGSSRTAIAADLGWTLNRVKDKAKAGYRKLGVHSKDSLASLLMKQRPRRGSARSSDEKRREPADGKKGDAKVSYVGISDFIVRSHGTSCRHKSHEMEPVEASVTVIVANSYLKERTFRAFYCRQCGKYFVTDAAFERLARNAKLCCKVIEMDEVTNPRGGTGRWAGYAEESLVHQYGYNVNKQDDLSENDRRAILSFIIENNIMGQYPIISFLEGLVRSRGGMRGMQDAVSKWKEDIAFLEQYKPPARSLKVGKLYTRRGHGS